VRIEACLNSRPLTPLTSDPNDLEVLTPFHFLIGETHTTFPEQDWSEAPTNRLSRWQLIEKIRAHFWKRWNPEYLTSLQNRQKWYKEAPVTDGKTNEGLARPSRIPEFVANQSGATTYTRLLVFVCF
jgi:hypothetical protein